MNDQEPEPKKETWVGTEDARHGGLEAVLKRTLEHYGLPPWAGLTGLLRHLEGSRAMHAAIQAEHTEMLQHRMEVLTDERDRLAASIRLLSGTDETVSLDEALRLLAEEK